MSKEYMQTLSEVSNDLKAQGYSEDFFFNEGVLKGMNNKQTYQAEQLSIRGKYRFEGESNPDDLSILWAIEAKDGTKGTISAAYGGSQDSLELEEFIKQADEDFDDSLQNAQAGQ